MAPENQIVNEGSTIVDLLGMEYEIMLEKAGELERLAAEIDKHQLEGELHIRVYKLNNYIHNELVKYFNSEEDYLFRELVQVMPDPSSAAVMKNEHFELIHLSNKIQNYLGDEHSVENRKDEIQGFIYQLADVLRRHIQKKNIMLHHEVCSLIPQEVMSHLYSEMYKRKHWVQ